MRATSLLTLVLITAIASAGSPKKFGKPVTLKEGTKVSAILADPDTYDGKKVRLEGVVVDVCTKRGRWIRVGSEKEFESIQLKVDDGVIVFPIDAKGETAVAEVIVEVTKMTKEELIEHGKHQAEETGKEFDPSTIEGSRTTVRILGEGAVTR